MNYKSIIFIILGISTFFLNAAWAFALGLIYALTVGNPLQDQTATLSKLLLQVSVVGLGFGINAHDALDVGAQGLVLTVGTITLTLFMAVWLGKRLNLSSHTALLIGSGTAICGGSAIAAVASAISAKPSDSTLALSTVFGLNAIALFLFPFLGRLLGLDDAQFGMWAAIAIHDTSSVVGAAETFSEASLKIATTVKLQRALWIIPLVLAISHFYKDKQSGKIKLPWFIFLFVLAMCVNTWLPIFSDVTEFLNIGARKALILTLFLIGASFQLETLKKVGIKPLILGVSLWIMISIVSLIVIIYI